MMGKNWKEIISKYNTQELIFGKIQKKIPGGVIVDVLGENGFLPWSQLPSSFKTNDESIIGCSVEFVIHKLNTSCDNIIVSRQAILKKEKEEERIENLKKIEVGGIYDGVVKKIVSYGVIVTIANIIDGLIPVKELTWQFFENINDVVNVNDPIKVKVISVDEENQKIGLSHKACELSPWETWDDNIYHKDAIIKGKIIKIVDSGLCLLIPNGCQALLYKNEITWENSSPDINSLFDVGQELEVKITNINKKKKQLHVSLKRMDSKSADYIRPGVKLMCTIDHDDDDGLHLVSAKNQMVFLPHKEISWGKKYDLADYVRNNRVQVIIIANQVGGHKNIASIRRLHDDPMLSYTIGSIRKGIVSGETFKVYFINFKDGLTGIILKNSLEIKLYKNQEVKTSVVEADTEKRHLVLKYVIESEFTGNDIMKELHIGPCREVGILKKRLLDAVNDGIVDTSYSAGRTFIKQIASEYVDASNE